MQRTTAAAVSSLFFAIAPGVVGGVIPWWMTRWETGSPVPHWTLRMVGAVLIVAGAIVLIQSFVRFVVEGAGTPAPVAPTERLVVGGLYRYVRNPMYLAVVAAIVGQALVLGQPGLFRYAAVVSVFFAAFVRWFEEPFLLRRFGAQYDAYRRAVPAWWPRLHAWEPKS